MLERSVHIAETHGTPPERIADTRVELARAVLARGDRAAALKISSAARGAARSSPAARYAAAACPATWMRDVSGRADEVTRTP